MKIYNRHNWRETAEIQTEKNSKNHNTQTHEAETNQI